jgi:hypothetical protein
MAAATRFAGMRRRDGAGGQPNPKQAAGGFVSTAKFDIW